MRYLLFSLAGLLAIAAALPAETPTGLPTETPVQQSVEYRQLQAVAAAPPPPKKSGFSIWSAAKNFFISREKVKAKVSGSPPPTSSLPMPAKYGVSYKGMIAWFCAKPENKVKALCKLQEQGKASDSQVRSDLVKPTANDSKEAFMAYCKEKKTPYICIQSSVHNKTAPSHAKPAAGKTLGTPTAKAHSTGTAKAHSAGAAKGKGVGRPAGSKQPKPAPAPQPAA